MGLGRNALRVEWFACKTLLFAKLWQVANDGLVMKMMQNKRGS